MRIIVLFGLLLFQTSWGQQEYKYQVPQQLEDGLQTADMRAFTQDTARIYELFRQLPGGDHEIKSILVLKNGQLMLERYIGLEHQNTQFDLRSATKSIRSLLIGIAIDKGFIESICLWNSHRQRLY